MYAPTAIADFSAREHSSAIATIKYGLSQHDNLRSVCLHLRVCDRCGFRCQPWLAGRGDG
ncbi:uncharacterized protein LAESUDRAFT_727431 [Laetiporus sulphureus 93-53]|uniref:Uncharacterized protein n=1 Tax=Laetiporus sulphureus 93-53 TaxID=1314785 RepID=A0A165DH15_9APHY|nr:uncharacterized protein LAESUDRAFT_727431 [Laetiporus sulphureus 93-53]KZT04860.1 hypothetical protein LAESUDRAFT_727431 [Laetiporus sulphureus 93-53]